MRIAVVLNTSWNIYNFRMGLIKKLLEQGHEVYALAPKDPYSDKIIEAGCSFYDLKMDSRGANPVKDAALIIELFSAYKRIKPDIILHFTIKPNIYGSIAASLLGIPVVNNVCGLGTVFLNKNLVARVAELLYKVAFKSPRKIYFQNEHDMNLFIEKKLIRNDVADLIPGSGINLDYFKPVPYTRNGSFTFLMISRLLYDKGISEFIEAIRIVRSKGINAKFQLLGAIDEIHARGIKTEVLRQWINEGLIDYLGTTEDVRPYIAAADCIVLPSYREGTPRTLLEAASSAKPIIATDVPGCNNVVENNFNGFLCRIKCAEDLADKMMAIAEKDDASLEQLGTNGRRKVEKEFGEHLVIDSYINTIGQLFGMKAAV